MQSEKTERGTTHCKSATAALTLALDLKSEFIKGREASEECSGTGSYGYTASTLEGNCQAIKYLDDELNENQMSLFHLPIDWFLSRECLPFNSSFTLAQPHSSPLFSPHMY